MTTYKIRFSKDTEKVLKKIGHVEKLRIISALKKLENNPRGYNSKRLTADREPLYRLRVGDYRIVYSIQDETLTVHVMNVGHRSVVYKFI
jgi:mRNA interferase RelE/StbE